VPVTPTSATDYIALQEGFTLAPEFEVLENAEIRGDISTAKPILGQENPTSEISHYIKHSGTEATAPEDNLLLKNAFGTTAIRATERNTIAASTVSLVKVDVGEGVEFQKGDLLRVQHASFPDELVTVDSVSGDDLTPAFDLQNAPATGTELGRNVVYRPANTRGSLSMFDFRSDGAALGVGSGMKVNELTIDFEAGQLLNGSYSNNGLEYFFTPIEITATTNDLDFTDDAGAQSVTLSTGYFKDPPDAAVALSTAVATKIKH